MGPLSDTSREWEGLDAQAGRADRGEQAEEEQEGWGEAVELVCERHDTHLEFWFWDPGGAGLSGSGHWLSSII